MLVKFEAGLFVAETTYQEREAPHKAGFYWHGGMKCLPGCKPCKLGAPKKVWWTDKAENAARLHKYADPTVKAMLKGVVEAVTLSKATDAAIAIPSPDGMTYHGYQKAGIAYAAERTGTLIADEMGLGKTIQALALCNLDESIKSVLVVCPGSLRLNWLREAETWLVRPFSFHVVEAGEQPPEDVNFVIVNFDRLIGENGAKVLKALMARHWDYLIIDEAHYLKNPHSQRAMAVLGYPEEQRIKKDDGSVQILPPIPGLVDCADKKVALTGTPLPNRPAEVFPLIRALAPKLFPDRKAFNKRYVSNSKYLVELQQKLRATMMVRRMKAEVLKDLPPKQRQVIVIPPNGASDLLSQEKAAWAAKEEAIAKFKAEKALAHAAGDKEAYENALAQLKDTIKAAFSEIAKIRHQLALAKVPYVLGHLDEMRENGIKKIVVFAHHKDVINAIANHFGDAAVTLTGETSMDDRQAAVDRFQKDQTCEVFIGGFKAAGVGITLTASSHVVFAEQDWTPAVLTQAEDRCHRIGQLWTVLAQHIVFDESLDARMAHYLIQKQALADKMLDQATEINEIDAPTLEVNETGKSPKPDATLAPLPKVYPVATEQERILAKEAMQLLAAACDGAHSLDGAGFSKIDTKIGKALAAWPKKYTDGQVFLAKRLAKIYKKQLPEALVLSLGFNKVTKGKKGAKS